MPAFSLIHPRCPRAAISCGLLVMTLAAACASAATAAYPGSPGPIAFAQSISRAPDFVVESESGLYAGRPGLGGETPRRLSAERDTMPSYSPSGRLIVFVRDYEPNRGLAIYVMRSDGSGVRPVTSGEFYDENPYFSPDGNRIVFDRRLSEGDPSHIYVVELDGSGLRRLTGGAQSDSEPVFTPSGRRIVYVSNGDVDGRRDRNDIWAMGPAGQDARVLIDGVRGDSEPDVSPDGRRIVFRSWRAGRVGLYVWRSGRGKVRALTSRSCTGCYTGPVWSPRGDEIAALSTTTYTTSIALIGVADREVRRFASGGIEAEGLGTRLEAPAWGAARG